MGNKSSTLQSTVNDIVNETTMAYISENSNTIADEQVTTQKVFFSNNTVNNCSINIDNSIISNSTLSAVLDENQQLDMTDDIENELTTQLQDIAKQTSGWLSLFDGANRSDATQELTNRVTNKLDQLISNKTLQQIFDNIIVDQSITVQNTTFNCDGKNDVFIGNNAIVIMVSQEVTKVVSNIVLSDKVVNDALTSMYNEVNQEQKGFSIGIGGIILIIAIVIIIIILAPMLLSRK